jgi:tRNA (cmo5U34)-methyltransferase
MGMTEFYDEIEQLLNTCKPKSNILILGCGTGLEIERIKFQTNVTAIDISPEMICELQKKEFNKGVNLETICVSILEYDFGEEKYDIVLTCYTLHHFNSIQKQDIYNRVYQCLKKNGILINGDTMSKSEDEENQRMNDAEKVYKAESLPFGSLHIDVPLTFKNEVSLLEKAGFQNIILDREWTKTKLFSCIK